MACSRGRLHRLLDLTELLAGDSRLAPEERGGILVMVTAAREEPPSMENVAELCDRLWDVEIDWDLAPLSAELCRLMRHLVEEEIGT